MCLCTQTCSTFTAAQLYAERYPNRYQPAHNYFLRLENQIRTYGSFGNRGNRRQIPQAQAEVNEETEIQVLAYVQINPRSSIRHVANEVGINPRKVQDGAPAHNAIIVRQYLNDQFGNNWMGTNGSIPWPARSPDLTPLDFFLWGHLKTVVYADPPINLQHLKQKITEACSKLTKEQITAASQDEVNRRLQSCLLNNGENFEQFIR
ncbi:uncharacterized protein LOC112596862 [Melanaphis sacchari]|uniref:uncharacterized protein LOC112596862 n=1 Tax=Melanaphis sacchari TaxID=742174 RepID=UPI000DC1412A|nr:uncharacterized protein LOC112596862 [Melanaphis sacchari]